MNIDKFKHQHTDILHSIATLRDLTHAGVVPNAAEIARRIVAMSGTIKLHLPAHKLTHLPQDRDTPHRALDAG